MISESSAAEIIQSEQTKIDYPYWTSANGLDKRTASIIISVMTDQLTKDATSYARVTWSGQNHIDRESLDGVIYNTLEPSNFRCGKNILALENPNSPNLKEVTKKEILKHEWLPMVEHWGALPVLLQTPVSMHFYQADTLYCMEALTAAAHHLLHRKRPAEELNYVTIDRPYTYKDEQDPNVIIHIKPRKEPGVTIQSYFNFDNHPKLNWVSEQEAHFDSSTVVPNTDYYKLFTLARAPVSHPLYIFKKIHIDRYFTHRTCVVTKNDKRPMWKNEVAYHKTLDHLGALNIPGEKFLAVDIEVEYAGHRHHLESTAELLQKRELIRL